MSDNNTSTFIERLRHQIKEEQRRYRDALTCNKEFWELNQIKSKINKLQASFERMMNNVGDYIHKNSQD